MTDSAIHEITAVLDRYCTAVDMGKWQLMEQVFLADAAADYAEQLLGSRSELVDFIRTAVGCCAAIHHVNGNVEAIVQNDEAQVLSKFSAWHFGKKESQDTIFHALGTNSDDFVRTASGWRIKHRVQRVNMEIWTRAT